MTGIAIDVASWAALIAGSCFYVIGQVGLIRMPDVFTRMHAVSVSDTLGAGLLIAGMVLQAGVSLVAAKLVLIYLVLLYTGSVAIHALARAALHDGVLPQIADAKGRLRPLDPAAPIPAIEDIAGPAKTE